MKIECGSCNFFWRDEGPVQPGLWLGQCRRHAPTGKLTNNRPTFPSTLSNEWCGEYLPASGARE